MSWFGWNDPDLSQMRTIACALGRAQNARVVKKLEAGPPVPGLNLWVFETRPLDLSVSHEGEPRVKISYLGALIWADSRSVLAFRETLSAKLTAQFQEEDPDYSSSFAVREGEVYPWFDDVMKAAR